jgi:CheY-like chemotaxis protein/HPt (histidine-containing phosphotransfer) domain-containing protein
MTLQRALIVDDDADIRTVAQISLSIDGTVDVATCGDGAAALALAAEFHPDVILLDVMMPDMDGPATLAHIRRIEALAHVPVIFLTARAETEVKDLLAAGAAAVVLKPFDPMQLLPKVREVCQATHEQRRPATRVSLPANLRQRFIRDAAELSQLEQRWAVAPSDEGEPIIAAAAHCTHKLKGAAAILGAPEVGAVAGRAHAALRALQPGEITERQTLPELRSLIELLETSASDTVA